MKPFRIIVWGCGSIYNAHLDKLRLMTARGEAEILGVCSRNLLYGKTLDGFPILKKEDIASLEHDYLLVMAKEAGDEIQREYIQLGGSRKKIIHYPVLDIPNLSISQYVQIRNSRFTILSETCFAGYLYKLLCLETLSPFKNLWVSGQDYFRILENFPYYMSLSPVFSHCFEGAVSAYEIPRYPVLKLGEDVLLYCNHYPDPETAITKWEERRKRIHYDNILVTFFAVTREQEKAFYHLRCPYKRLCFTPYKSEYPDSIFIPKENGEFLFTELHRIARPYNTLIDTYSLFFGPVQYRRI